VVFFFFFLKKRKEILSFSEKKLGFLGWSVVTGFSSMYSIILLIFCKYWKKILYPKWGGKKKKNHWAVGTSGITLLDWSRTWNFLLVLNSPPKLIF
jgi:hypothetical protein